MEYIIAVAAFLALISVNFHHMIRKGADFRIAIGAAVVISVFQVVLIAGLTSIFLWLIN